MLPPLLLEELLDEEEEDDELEELLEEELLEEDELLGVQCRLASRVSTAHTTAPLTTAVCFFIWLGLLGMEEGFPKVRSGMLKKC